jgi:YD repeat-containing protein
MRVAQGWREAKALRSRLYFLCADKIDAAATYMHEQRWRLVWHALWIMCLAAGRPVAAEDVQYVYDGAGRVVQVIAADGSSAQYRYDTAGNIIAVERATASTVAISALTPSGGPPGTLVMISGSGFSPAAVQNAVSFNGVTAAVSSATANTLQVIVPKGATTGLVAVGAPGGSASSARPFIVTAPLEISGFTPSTGGTGANVTITGVGFSPAITGNTVLFNAAKASVASASATQLQVAVPTGAASGRITVTTQSARALSASDFIIPPAALTSEDILATGRIVSGGTGVAVALSAANKAALYLFDGVQGQNFSLLFTAVTLSGSTFAVYRPNGASLLSGNISEGAVFDLPVLPETGTYSIAIKSSSTVGSVNVRLLPLTTGIVRATGEPAALSLVAGQNAALTFNGAAGQFYSLVLTHFSSVPSGGSVAAIVMKPDGSTLMNCGTFTATTGNCDFGALPSTGIYTVRLDPAGTAAVAFNAVVSTDLFGSLSLNAAPTPFNTGIAGQNIRYTFSGAAGQNITAVYSNNTIAKGTLFIFRPDGTTLAWRYFNSTTSGYLDATLPTTGPYRAVIYLDGDSTGHMDVGIVAEATRVADANGTPTALSLTSGQNAALTFSGSANQFYSLVLTNFQSTPTGGSVAVTVNKPDGSTLMSCGTFSATSGNCDLGPFPSTGTYTVHLDPAGTSATSFNVVLSADRSGTLNFNTEPATFSTNIPGQNIRYAFSGTMGQGITFAYSNNSIARGTLFLFNPDRSLLTWMYFSNTTSGYLDATLSSTGTYSAVVFVDGDATGQIDVRLVGDATGVVATDGTPLPLSLAAGQNATLGFNGTAGRGYSLAMPGFSATPLGGAVSIGFKKPDGTTFTSGYGCATTVTASTANCDISPLPITGTYSLRIDPQSLVAASMNVVLSENLAGGNLIVGSPAATYQSSIPGQNANYVLNGVAGQNLSLIFSSNTIPTGTLFVFALDGSTLASRNINGTASGTLTIPSLPATGAYSIILFTDGSSTGTVTLKLEAR